MPDPYAWDIRDRVQRARFEPPNRDPQVAGARTTVRRASQRAETIIGHSVIMKQAHDTSFVSLLLRGFEERGDLGGKGVSDGLSGAEVDLGGSHGGVVEEALDVLHLSAGLTA